MLAKSNSWQLNHGISMNACGPHEEITSNIYLVHSSCTQGIVAFSSILRSSGNETFNKMVVQKLGNWEKTGENELNSLTAKLDF